jgi:hypothetical protein
VPVERGLQLSGEVLFWYHGLLFLGFLHRWCGGLFHFQVYLADTGLDVHLQRHL